MSSASDAVAEPLFARRVLDAALDRARTRNPSERACAFAPTAIARALDRCARAYAEDSARAAALRRARRDAARASTARPDARALLVLLGQAIETTDRRRRGTLAAIARRAREGRRTCERLRAFAEANEWTATELEGSRAEEARAIGATKRALAKSERARAAALEAIVGRDRRGGKRKMDAASANADAAPRTPAEKRRARAGPRIVASKPAASGETADDSDEEPMMTAEGPPEEESPAATEATRPTQPASDEDSDGERALGTLTSPTTKNVAQILMEMDLPNHGVSISDSPEKDEDEN